MRLRTMSNTLRNTATAVSLIALVGCAATQIAIEHRNLEVSTKQSETLFLDPVPKSQKTVFLSIKNTSNELMDIKPELNEALSKKGYRVVKEANQAHYLLQANIRTVGKMSTAASKSALGGGYGSSISGAVVGAAAGSFSSHSSGMIAGGLAGGVIGLAADSLVKDVNYTMITDVQISERVGRGVKVNEHFESSLKQGTSSRSYQTSSKASDYERFRTRIVSNADQVNLKFPDARRALEQGLVKSITEIF